MKFRLLVEENELEKMARRNRKHQKGLSPFSYLNPSAGNVEKNIDIFNSMSGTGSSPSSSEAVSGETVSEMLKEELNRSFVELPSFSKSWKDLGLTDKDLMDLQNLIINHSESAVSLGQNVFKIRFSPESLRKGKSTSHRVLYIDVIKDSLIYLAAVYSKSNESNITPKEREAIKNASKELDKGK